MRHALRLPIVIWLAALTASACGEEFVSLFDGTSLNGWRVVPAEHAADWSVAEGAIVGASRGKASFLVWKDEDLSDFELQLEFRLPQPGSNSGVTIRAQLATADGNRMAGYHADLGDFDVGPNLLGAWDYHGVDGGDRGNVFVPRGQKVRVDPEGHKHFTNIADALAAEDIHDRGWNELRIIARGKHLTFQLNGKTASEVIDEEPAKFLRKGGIGLQLHSGEGITTVEFKDIKLRRIPPDESHACTSTYYVSPDGSDANNGSQDRPWLTLSHAARQVEAGDVVKMKSGVYRGTQRISDCHGTAEQPIVFEADGGPVLVDAGRTVTGWRSEGGGRWSIPIDREVHAVWAGGLRMLDDDLYNDGRFREVKPTAATLKRLQALTENSRLYVRLIDSGDPNQIAMRIALGHCVVLQNCRYTVWRGIGAAWANAGYKLQGGSSHNVVSDAEIHHTAEGILENAPVCRHNTFQRLHIHHIGLTSYGHGIYTSGTDTRILSCRFDHIAGAPIHAYPDPLRGHYDGNVMSDPLVSWREIHFRGENPPDPDPERDFYTALICSGKGRHRVTNNLIVGPFGDGIRVRADDCELINNTIVLERGPAVRLVRGHGNDLRLANNVFQTGGTYLTSDAPVELDYNAWFGGRGWRIDGMRYETLAELKAAGLEKHGLEADPQFAGPGEGDYRLRADSPLVDVGATSSAPETDFEGKPRPQGEGVDLGAFERPPHADSKASAGN